MNKIKGNRHILELDGLRGLAVLVVMLFHFNFIEQLSHSAIDNAFNNIINLGWIGVDLFFVLSGFLITGILIDKKEKANYFLSFYYRRTLRIFPLYYLYLIVLFFVFYPYVITKVSPFEIEKIHFTQSIQGWFWTYLSNIKQAIDGKFSSAGSAHLWSLAIEEQFYLIWPFVVFKSSNRSLKFISIGVIIFSLTLRIYLYNHGWGPQSIYIFTFTRVDSLAFGSLVAVLVRIHNHISYQKITYLFYSLLTLLTATFCFFGTDYHLNPVIYVFSFTLSGATFALLIFLLQSGNTFSFPIRSFFLKKWIVFLGKYSYGLYIFHPFIRFALSKVFGKPKIFFNSEIPWQICFFSCCLVVTIIISQLSWHLYEKHFLRLKDKIN